MGKAACVTADDDLHVTRKVKVRKYIDQRPVHRCHDGAFRRINDDMTALLKGNYIVGKVVGDVWHPL